jgi:hypothetical protein
MSPPVPIFPYSYIQIFLADATISHSLPPDVRDLERTPLRRISSWSALTRALVIFLQIAHTSLPLLGTGSHNDRRGPPRIRPRSLYASALLDISPKAYNISDFVLRSPTGPFCAVLTSGKLLRYRYVVALLVEGSES